MSILEFIEQLKAMPEKMEGRNGEGELVVLNTHKLADELKKSLRNCDVGTAEEQEKRYLALCDSNNCSSCPVRLKSKTDCVFTWEQMPYEEGCAE